MDYNLGLRVPKYSLIASLLFILTIKTEQNKRKAWKRTFGFERPRGDRPRGDTSEIGGGGQKYSTSIQI